MKRILLLLLSVVVLFSSCTFTSKKQGEKITEKQKFIGVWFTYKEIEELCNESNSEGDLKENIKEILTELEKYKVNNMFLHTRAFDDCFYKSLIFNASDCCKDEHGKLKFDVLQCFIEVADEYDISVHAWVNPYRIRNDNNIEKIPQNSFAGEIISQDINDERIILTANSIYYNPAYPEIQKYVLNGIREILENYNIKGIHIDDYFYPTNNEEIDKSIYNDYIKKGGALSIGDFRRNAINGLISSIYSLVKSYDDNLLISISPSADIEKNYNNSYADVKFWAQNDGYADILIPQLYYGFNHSTMPFNKLLNVWMNLSNSKTKIIIGLASYKAGIEDLYAQEGRYEWVENDNIISEQINHISHADAYGWSYFSASYLY